MHLHDSKRSKHGKIPYLHTVLSLTKVAPAICIGKPAIKLTSALQASSTIQGTAHTEGKLFHSIPCFRHAIISDIDYASAANFTIIMRPSSLGGGRILRRTLSVCLSVRPVILTERHVAPPSELQWHTCTFRHALRAAYRTAISAAQILVSSY